MPYLEYTFSCSSCGLPVNVTPAEAEDENATVVCTWCGTPHPARQNYFDAIRQRLDRLTRGATGDSNDESS